MGEGERESEARDERKIEGGKRRFERRLLLQSTSVVTAHSPIWSNLRFPSAQIENIRPRLLSLLPPQRRGGEGRTSAAHLAPPLPSRAEVEALLGVGAWPAVLVTVPKLPQNGLLRSLPLSLPPLRIFPLSLSFDALVADNHPSQKDTCPLSAFSLTFLPSTTFVSILSHPSARSARFPRFSNLPESTLDSVDKRDNKCPSAIAWSRTRVHRTDGFREPSSTVGIMDRGWRSCLD